MVQIKREEWEVLSSSMIVKYVAQKGFANIVTFDRNESEKPYMYENNKLYALVSDIEGERFELSSKSNVMAFSELLANFHNYSEGFNKPPGVKIKTEWGKTIEKYKTMARRLERYMKVINQRGIQGSFEEYTYKCMEPLLNKAVRSIKVFKSSGYLKTLEKSMMNKEICLNTISDNTAIKNNEKLIIKDIFDLSYNMTLEDISCLIKKSIERLNSKELCDEVISSYSRIRELDGMSKNVVKAMINYPYDSIRVINKYLEMKSDEKSLLEKFKRYYERELRNTQSFL